MIAVYCFFVLIKFVGTQFVRADGGGKHQYTLARKYIMKLGGILFAPRSLVGGFGGPSWFFMA